LHKPLQAFILILVVQTWRGKCPGLSKRMGSMNRSLMSVPVVTLSVMAVAIAEELVSVLRGAP
jgi:hypothetical protein